MRVRRLVAETAADPSPRAVRNLLAECRLPLDDGLIDRRPGALSGGQQRRVALARALARRPDVLLLDEPTAGLDTALRDEIAGLLRSLATTRDMAVVLACHDPDLVGRCADEVVELAPALRPAPRPAVPTGRRGRAGAGPGDTPGAGLAAHGLEVTFTRRGHAHRALAGVDFAAAPGSAAGVVGPSGSGKTTLLRVLAGLRRPDAGTLTLDGRPLPALARERGRGGGRRVQLVPQNPSARSPRPDRRRRPRPAPPPAPDHGEGGRRRAGRGTPGRRRPARRRRPPPAPRALRRAAPTRLHRPRPGLRPRRPAVREVTSALDPNTAAAVLDLLTGLRATRRLTLVLVSHELDLVAAYTDTVHILAAGRVTASGPTGRLLPARR
ncbi:ATP-binding cassette domain-containing protein [Streptomyces griseocarneus]|uniref:ATP-binding cassette domain-containing protein n=1 Tax=Streptomyces griseocarneus TaxID=51201 RepID=A0ABX7RHM4_9ACTN|nr:ATP-binding cassette domain-containing protein [Streptomyces griseocarneus]